MNNITAVLSKYPPPPLHGHCVCACFYCGCIVSLSGFPLTIYVSIGSVYDRSSIWHPSATKGCNWTLTHHSQVCRFKVFVSWRITIKTVKFEQNIATCILKLWKLWNYENGRRFDPSSIRYHTLFHWFLIFVVRHGTYKYLCQSTIENGTQRQNKSLRRLDAEPVNHFLVTRCDIDFTQ